ncbi:hypothetical protein [Heyndrickxia camelliae]|uniref:Uncharacterized protein n=1 Tax=Heyndrickxia camelliae TaxID=1707093 RepID=A0A2N3LEA9_9BACI|nr:hypothetical protein [Heyndrickxia camelliae]PKR82883.1 hypothetical protein CWO92_22090 [Heyndrickxia camelliae]
MNIKTTVEYFDKDIDELLETRSDTMYTKEENLLFDEGLNVTFFDDMEEYEFEQDQFEEWMTSRGMELKALLKTINGRIAAVLI